MRIVRILQVVGIVLLVVYGVIVHNANPQLLALPWLMSLPPVLVILGAVALTFLLSWIPPTVRAWQREREVARLRRRLAELEQHVPNYDYGFDRRDATPVIPDRTPAPAPPPAVPAPDEES